jgi:hypothetical protein
MHTFYSGNLGIDRRIRYINMNINEIGCESVDWIQVALERDQ